MSEHSSQPPDSRLTRLLGGDALEPLRRRLRRHFERHGGRAGHALQLTNLSAAEQEALSLLTGRPPRSARSMRLDIEQLDISLQAAGIASSLRAALEVLDGAIEDRAALRHSRLLRWTQVVGADRWHPLLHAWLQMPASQGLLKRLARGEPDPAEQLLTGASTVMQRLPAVGVTRAQLAAETLGDAHSLDNGEPTATLVLSALRQAGRRPLSDEDEAGSLTTTTVKRARDLWADAGVLVNELARPALCLNLPSRGVNDAEPGEPRYLSLRKLLRSSSAWDVAGRSIYVCENPNVLAIAADRLGADCASLVCTEGMPAAAQRTLLNQLADANAHLLYHGDFDWPGLRIGNYVMRTWQASAWRFGSSEYEAAVAGAPHRRRVLHAIPVVATWDPALTAAMSLHGITIAEEAVVEALLEDLASNGADS